MRDGGWVLGFLNVGSALVRIRDQGRSGGNEMKVKDEVVLLRSEFRLYKWLFLENVLAEEWRLRLMEQKMSCCLCGASVSSCVSLVSGTRFEDYSANVADQHETNGTAPRLRILIRTPL